MKHLVSNALIEQVLDLPTRQMWTEYDDEADVPKSNQNSSTHLL